MASVGMHRHVTSRNQGVLSRSGERTLGTRLARLGGHATMSKIALRRDDVTNLKPLPRLRQTFAISVRVASENMPLASTSVRSFTVLTEDDGSKFERDPENYTVEQLRRWLNII